MRLVFDIETDGLLDACTKVHVINATDVDTGQTYEWSGGPAIEKGLSYLMNAEEIIGHNIIGFDIPALEKLHGFIPPKRIFDTMVASSVIWTNLADKDFEKIRVGKLPHEFQKKGLIGKQKLEAWGYRLGELKGTFDGPWHTFTEEMAAYARQDVVVTLKLYRLILSKNYSKECLDLEHAVKHIIHRQTEQGFPIDLRAVMRLAQKLQGRRAELEAELQRIFPPWQKHVGTLIPKRDNSRYGYKAGVPFEKYKTIVFNPGSRDHIADRLITLRGWNPTSFTDGGKPQVDDAVLGELPWPEAKVLAEYMMIQKRLGQISDGDKAWLTLAKPGADGVYRLHGTVWTNGAVTGRMTHSDPNIAQVPKVGSPYGLECRSCFIATPGYLLVGCDAEGIELRMLAHYLAFYDGGAYAQAVVNGKKEDKTDAHSINQQAISFNARDNAKTFLYALIYGAGDFKLGMITVEDMTDERREAFYRSHPDKRQREGVIKGIGRNRRAALMTKVPAFGKLVEVVQRRVREKGYLVGLDGRRLHVRGQHSALNTLLQSGGAVVMKKALVLLDRSMNATVRFVANVHDEFQVEEKPHNADGLGRAAADAIRLAGEHFKLRCPLSGSYGVGASWAETH